MGGSVILTIGGIILACILGAVLLGFGIYFFIALMRVLGKLIIHVFTTLGAWIGDVFRLIGAVIVSIVFVPLTVLNVAIGRWSASAHYGRAFTSECKTVGACLYRIAIGHPLRLIGLSGLTEGLEKRLPQAMADAPGSDRPSKRQGMFEGYTIVGSLQGGGSGGKLYIAEPDELKKAAFNRQGFHTVDRVVIKTFSLGDGSSLPQIVRESRALDAAKKMGLVLEHELNDERFYYVMRYVPGDSLTVVTQRMHASAEPAGLGNKGLAHAIGYATDLLEGLDVYHRGGLWHKDVKPDNLIVDREEEAALGRGRAHLVDFGLITPLRSAMTLTTHGTEYFRDPELVRQALRGVKVHQIDGARFDVYAAGAVLFSMIENSFPAHGGLSRVSKRCPEAVRWIIRRAMADYDKRYATAREMLDDLAVVTTAADPFAVKPADLPSVSGNPVAMPEYESDEFTNPSSIAPSSEWIGRRVRFINPRTGHKKTNVVDERGRVWVNYKQHPVVTYEGSPCVVWETKPEVGACVLDGMRILQRNDKWLLIGKVVEANYTGPSGPAVPIEESENEFEVAAAGASIPHGATPLPVSPDAPVDRTLPRLRLTNWWSGRYDVDRGGPQRKGKGKGDSPVVFAASIGIGSPKADNARRSPRPPAAPRRAVTPVENRLSAAEQRANARQRVADRRAAAKRRPLRAGAKNFNPAAGPTTRLGRPRRRHEPAGVNAGVAIASLFVIGLIAGAVAIPLVTNSRRASEAQDVARREAAQQLAELDMHMPAVAPDAPDAPDGLFADTHGGLASHHAADVRDGLVELVPVPEGELEGLDVVVLFDFRAPYSKEVDRDLDVFDRVLADHGVRLGSNLIVEYADEVEDQDHIVAKLKSLRGFRSISDALGNDVRDYIAETPGVDAVWWAAPDDDDSKRKYLLATDDCVSVFTSADITLMDITTAFVAQYDH